MEKQLCGIEHVWTSFFEKQTNTITGKPGDSEDSPEDFPSTNCGSWRGEKSIWQKDAKSESFPHWIQDASRGFKMLQN